MAASHQICPQNQTQGLTLALKQAEVCDQASLIFSTNSIETEQRNPCFVAVLGEKNKHSGKENGIIMVFYVSGKYARTI